MFGSGVGRTMTQIMCSCLLKLFSDLCFPCFVEKLGVDQVSLVQVRGDCTMRHSMCSCLVSTQTFFRPVSLGWVKYHSFMDVMFRGGSQHSLWMLAWPG